MTGPVSVCERLMSSHGVSVTAATTMSPAAAVTTPLRGRTGGGLLGVSVVAVLVAVMITLLRRIASIGRNYLTIARTIPGQHEAAFTPQREFRREAQIAARGAGRGQN